MIKKSFFGMMVCLLLLATNAAGENSDKPASLPDVGIQEQVDNLNAVLEQVFRDIPQGGPKAEAGLIDKVYDYGTVPVIVRLRDSDLPYGFFSDKESPRADVIDILQGTVLDDVLAQTARDEVGLHVKRFSMIPAMALQVDAQELEALLANPNVIDVVEDIPVPPTLQGSVPLIGAGLDGSFSTYTGQGQAVAILDTGVDKNQPFLSGKVVSEACYSSTVSTYGSTSLCPGGVAESTAVGSGLNCNRSLVDGCAHGTHVSGIAAGSGSTFSGVAKDASIIAIQVFSLFYGANCGSSSPCVLSYTSDQIKGLERVYALRNIYSIASANLSLGGGSYTAPCPTASQKPIIDSLRTAGIATVISSGNNGYTTSIGSPGCIESAVSVGSTTKADVVSYFSNSAYFLSLLAPGSSITSSVPGTTYETWSGTSMAAPHVTGAWAVLKQAKPSAGVTEVLSALQTTGVPVTDTRTGAGNRVKPRIDVQNALDALNACEDSTDCPDNGIYCDGTPVCTANVCGAGTAPCPGQICDEANDACVECLADGNCVGGYCVATVCVDCRNDGDCPEDGNYCNGEETCSAGVCVSAGNPCAGATPLCDEAGDRCVACLDSASCDDGLFCNGAETCTNGVCAAGTAPSCTGATPLCDEADDQCVECLNSADCTDGLFCNGDETCAAGVCAAGTAPSCTGDTPVCDEAGDQCVECLINGDCPSGDECINDVCVPIAVDNPPAITAGPYVVGSWQLLPTAQEQAMLLSQNSDFLWTFSDDFVSCSNPCTFTAEYKNDVDSTWKALTVSDDADQTAWATLPIAQLQNGTYAFRFTVTDCADQTTQSATYYFKVDRLKPPPIFTCEPRWVGGVWPVLSSNPAKPHKAMSDYSLIWAFDVSRNLNCQGRTGSRNWMYRPVELQEGVVVPLGDWIVMVPNVYLTWVWIEDPNIADIPASPGVYEFKMTVTDCTGQMVDSEVFFGTRYYFKVE